VNLPRPEELEKQPNIAEFDRKTPSLRPKKWYWSKSRLRSMICGGKAQGQIGREGISMRLQHSIGRVGVSSARTASQSFASSRQRAGSGRLVAEEEPLWDPVKASGGIVLIALLAGSAWLEWEFAKWVFSLFA
jgi:hypothetical protein